MGKNMIMKLQERMALQAAVHEEAMIMFNRGLSQDAAVLAANRVFGMGPKRCIEFILEYNKVRNELNRIIDEDYKDDPSIVYAQDKIDEIMRACYELPNAEEHWMPPFRQRYGLEGGGTRTTVDIDERQLTDKVKKQMQAAEEMERGLKHGTIRGTVDKMEAQEAAIRAAKEACEGKTVTGLDGLKEAMEQKDRAVAEAEQAMERIDRPHMGDVVDDAMKEWAGRGKPDRPKTEHHHKPRKGGKKK